MALVTSMSRALLAWCRLLLFRFLNAVFTSVRNILLLCNGTQLTLNSSRSRYQKSAHRMRIWSSHILDIMNPLYLSNFFLTHDSFVDPEYVLTEHVSLLQVTKGEAVFIEGARDMPPAFSTTFSFVTLGQMKTGRYIITMPMDSFLRLTESVRSDGKLIFVHNGARCGSSLVTSILAHTGHVVAWNEPRVLDNICRCYNHWWDRKTSKRLLRAAVNMFTKPYRGLGTTPIAYVIKLCGTLTPYMDFFFDGHPKASHIFVYRNINSAAASFERVLHHVPSVYPMLLTDRIVGIADLTPALLYISGLPGKVAAGMRCRFQNILRVYGYKAAKNGFEAFQRIQARGLKMTAIRYEDLLADPEYVVSELLKLCGIPLSSMSSALKALEKDSQSAAPFNRQITSQKVGIPDISNLEPGLLDDIQEDFEESGLVGPKDWSADFRLPGSIVRVTSDD